MSQPAGQLVHHPGEIVFRGFKQPGLTVWWNWGNGGDKSILRWDEDLVVAWLKEVGYEQYEVRSDM